MITSNPSQSTARSPRHLDRAKTEWPHLTQYSSDLEDGASAMHAAAGMALSAAPCLDADSYEEIQSLQELSRGGAARRRLHVEALDERGGAQVPAAGSLTPQVRTGVRARCHSAASPVPIATVSTAGQAPITRPSR